jgi:hypothetical protein
MKKLLFILTLPILAMNCGNNGTSTSKGSQKNSKEFSQFWYKGKAEITSYKLQQARYGEIHDGTAITIFVTEDFSKEKHVKLDNPQIAGDDAVPVLKLNLVKKFNTGVYPYSMMLSVFKPVDTNTWKHALKITASSQEWCGHTFTQIDSKNNNFLATLYSYFESEGTNEKKISMTYLEDELWVQLRIDPMSLPTGELQVIPGLLQQRLLHSNLQEEKAFATLEKSTKAPQWLATERPLMQYALNYEALQRKLTIYFNQGFPYEIAGWEESYPDPFGKVKHLLTTKAVKNKTLMLDYWNHHDKKDAALRDSLGLN